MQHVCREQKELDGGLILDFALDFILSLSFFFFHGLLLELEEDGVVLKLCIVDTPGFSDELNREHK